MLSLYKFLKFIFRYLLPGNTRYQVARWIARGVCLWDSKRRRVIVANLTPIVGPKRAAALTPELLGNFFMTSVDFFCPRRPLASEMAVENESVIEETLRRGRKIVFVSAHLGHWELGMSYLVHKGYPAMGMYAVYREGAVVRWIHTHRNPQVEWVPAAPGAVEACLNALERGRLVALVADLPFGEKGRRVEIAGTPARLPLGPWVIAARARATVIPSFIVREEPGRYRLIFHEPIGPREGPFRRQIEEMQDIYRRHLEQYLHRYPAQWGVLQPFWEQ